jgi:AcrR family transcriptional regulator
VTATQVTSGRPYRGLSPEERAAARRERLLSAALELYGAPHAAPTTIAQICAAARVTTRNFYDAFGSREELLLALYERLLAEQASRVRAALAAIGPDTSSEAQARQVIEAFVRPWAEDPRRARVAQREILGINAEVDRHTLFALNAFAAMIAGHTGAPHLVCLALVGAVNQSLMVWHTMPRAARPPIDELIDALTTVAARTLAG